MENERYNPALPTEDTDIAQFAASVDKVISRELFLLKSIEMWIRRPQPNDWNEAQSLLQCLLMKIPSGMTLDLLVIRSRNDSYHLTVDACECRWISWHLTVCELKAILNILTELECTIKEIYGMTYFESVTGNQYKTKLEQTKQYSERFLKYSCIDVISSRIRFPFTDEQLKTIVLPKILMEEVTRDEKVANTMRELKEHHQIQDKCSICDTNHTSSKGAYMPSSSMVKHQPKSLKLCRSPVTLFKNKENKRN